MAKAVKTTHKRHIIDPNVGVKFSADNQPAPEAKRLGWEELRKKRYLTQLILKEMIGDDGEPTDSLGEYITALRKLAKEGNPKAIDTINKCLEDDIQKVAQVDSSGNDVTPVINITAVATLPIEETE